jgi:hypothetical protein
MRGMMLGVVLALKITWEHKVTYGDAVVGIGTLALAFLTVFLGWETRKSARAAREAVEASEEPFVIATPNEDPKLRNHERGGWLPAGSPESRPPLELHRSHEDPPNEGTHFVRLKLWNIGLGPTIVENVVLRGQHGANYLVTLPEFQPLGAGHAADIEIRSDNWQSDARGHDLLRIIYRHASGRVYETASVVEIIGDIIFVKTYDRVRMKAPGALIRLGWRLGLQPRPGLQRRNLGLPR